MCARAALCAVRSIYGGGFMCLRSFSVRVRVHLRALLAAGVTWMSRTASAPWAGRSGHTSVIDAAGAIYVIGGYVGRTLFHDVWASTDGGADETRAGGVRGV